MRSQIQSACEPADPPHAIQAALAASLVECLAAIRHAKPRDPVGGEVSKRRCDSRLVRQLRRAWELQAETASLPH